MLPWKMSRLSAGPDTDPVRANESKVAVMERSSRSPGDVVCDDGELRITRLGDEPWLVVACGRYEGIDARVTAPSSLFSAISS